MATRTVGKTGFTVEDGSHAITVTRDYDAPREKVFRAMTEPQFIPQWWGPAGFETTVDRADVRPGGDWRFVQKDGSGEYAFHGVYHEVAAPERVVQTFEFEGMPGHVLLETVVLEDLGGGRTRYTSTSVFQSVEDRDGMLAEGMEEGTVDGLDRLEALAQSL